MESSLAALSPREFEKLGEQVIDRRMSVWLTQLLDALGNEKEENDLSLQPDFAASLERSLAQAKAGETIDLQSFREQLARE